MANDETWRGDAARARFTDGASGDVSGQPGSDHQYGARHVRHDSTTGSGAQSADSSVVTRRVASEPIAAAPAVQHRRETIAATGTHSDIDRQHEAFGGMKFGSGFFGWLCAMGIAAILASVLSAAGAGLGLAENADPTNTDSVRAMTIAGGIGLLVTLFLAYLAGGYVAGRMARFDGARQGVAVWLWGLLATIVAAIAGAVLGSQYNIFANLNLPRIPVSEGTVTTGALVALAAIMLATLAGAVLGGKLGTRYHRKVDDAGIDPYVK